MEKSEMSERVLLFYGAGEHAELIFKRAQQAVAPRVPIAFIDGDPLKQGKTLCALPIISLTDAIGKYGDDFAVFITANERNAPDIIGYLLKNGIARERILNYEPVTRYRGCHYLESILLLQFNGEAISVKTCDCISEGGQTRPRPAFDIPPHDFTTATFQRALDYMDNLEERIKNQTIPDVCAACPFIEEAYYFTDRKKRHLILGGACACNYHCLHCTNSELFTRYTSSVTDDLNRALDVIEASGVLHDNATIAHSVGEFTLDSEHHKFLERISKYNVMLYSNGSIYSGAVAALLKKGNASITISVDAGSSAAYQKIKGIDAYAKVLDNIKLYARAGNVILKYIMFEGINVNATDIGNFIEFADQYANKVIISRDFYATGTLSDATLRQAAAFIHHFRQQNKLSKIVGYQRGDETCRLQNLLDEIS